MDAQIQLAIIKMKLEILHKPTTPQSGEVHIFAYLFPWSGNMNGKSTVHLNAAIIINTGYKSVKAEKKQIEFESLLPSNEKILSYMKLKCEIPDDMDVEACE